MVIGVQICLIGIIKVVHVQRRQIDGLRVKY